MPSNEEEGVDFEDPKTLDERREAARGCVAALPLRMTCVVDDLEDTVDALYAGWPERLFVIERGGKIAVAGKKGPFGFEPEEVERWLRRNVGGPLRAPAPGDSPPAPPGSAASLP